MKHLCELNKKGFDKISEKIETIVLDPEYICKKCLRVANKEGRLCKPSKLRKNK